MSRPGFLLLFFNLILSVAIGGDRRKGEPLNQLEIVFCLDLSGSTNGLVVDVRNQLWHIINQANELRPKPELKIGVVGFSRPSFKKENSYVKVLADLTADFDKVAFELNKIRPSIEKGDQFVGAAILTCINKISWSGSRDAVKIIYIAGNGITSVNNNEFVVACNEASERGIKINSLYAEGKVNKIKELAGWKRIATLTNAYSGEITVGKQEQEFDESTDAKRLFEAVRKLNLSYIYYGEVGAQKYAAFRSSDSSAYAAGTAVFIERSFYKCRNLKRKNADWDIIDAYMSEGSMPDLNRQYLPDSLKSRSDDDIYKMVLSLKSQRERAWSEMDFLLASAYRQNRHQAHVNGEVKEENIFSRNVINMLVKCWYNRALREADAGK